MKIKLTKEQIKMIRDLPTDRKIVVMGRQANKRRILEEEDAILLAEQGEHN